MKVARFCLLLAMASPCVAHAQAERIALEPCTLPGADGAVDCGYHEVFEDRATRSGRKIRLFVAVLRAEQQPAAPDPLFVLAGGPGQAASDIAGFAGRAFAELRLRRDIVLVDMAGTGRSEALRCEFYTSAQELAGDMYPPQRIRACRQALEGTRDLRRYVTPTLVDDLDEVRAALGYARINIYGTSYGSRAAFEYLRRHGEHVRSVVMKAVVPPTMRGVMHYARDTERSLQMLFRACAEDAACARAYPDLDAGFRQVLERADRGELRGSVPDPAGGPAQELPLSRGLVASSLLGLLQNSNSAVRLPLLVHRAFHGDTGPLIEMIAAYRRGLQQGISFGMHLSVMCSEDAAHGDAAATAQDRDTALGNYRVAQLAAACKEWVRGAVPRDTWAPVKSNVPALLISGTLDPNTNERWGEEGMRGLSRATHVVIPNLSHGFSSIADCGAGFMTRFIEQASMDGVDVSCKDRVKLPRFELPPPILDVHLHAVPVEGFAALAGPPPIPHCVPMTDYPSPDASRDWHAVMKSRDLDCKATWSPATDDEVMRQTLAAMERHNVFGVVSGPLSADYLEAAPGRVIRSLSFSGAPGSMSFEEMRKALRSGEYSLVGEVTAQYGGVAADDDALAGLWALAEELDVPVGIHVGTGPVGAPYLPPFDRYRARLHSVLALEEVLVRHPRLRVYVMHAGWPMLDDLLAVLWAHPQLYVDTGAISWALPRAEFHRYLQRIVEAGFGKRVLFGSDQMIWPETIEMALEAIESAIFLSGDQKRDILYRNAARFLRLADEVIARHHGWTH